ncbi:hypothetical protein ZOSMA_246G00330 [Zostera marina]|uniref:Pseudouridine synthase I TruA alpha/beta domain-containing protein n=1 Tax=Zostera marina TaxID=29655 RepID=A0A0K9PH13_ZOSMR|nr:hypothetical protein ZOSMA_246G00330 [Zostera marina]
MIVIAAASLRFSSSSHAVFPSLFLPVHTSRQFLLVPARRDSSISCIDFSPPPPPPPSPSSSSSDGNGGMRWESFRKKKVVMRVGYVGTDYRGLQIQRGPGSFPTIEGELEAAIFRAGGIHNGNFGDLYKIGWTRSSRTDKGVHSLSTMISLKMEIPENAWKDDLSGILLADYVNSNLPNNIKVFSILPSQK